MRALRTGRRRRDEDAGGSFDSLLDTMTNVVGILVVMLAVTQLGVRDAVRQIQSNLPSVSEADLANVRNEAETVHAELSALQASQSGPPAGNVREMIAALEDRIKLLEQNLAAARPSGADTGPLEKESANLRARLKEVEKSAAQDRKRLAEVNDRLEKTPTPRKLPAHVVRLPNPRPAPKGAPCFWFTCSRNRIAFVDAAAMRTMAKERVENTGARLTQDGKFPPRKSGLKRPGQKTTTAPIVTYNGEKVMEYFKQRDIGTRDHRLSVRLNSNRREELIATHRPNAGEAARVLRAPYSKYRRALKQVAKKRGYVRFAVCADSFAVYTAAREVLEEQRLLAGWILRGKPEVQVGWGFGLAINGEKTPPPPATPAPPGKPSIVLD